MDDLTSFQLLDYLGVFVFALTGALVATRKGLDVFGLVVLALIPAVGGGTLRDLILDVPVFWLVDITYLYLCLVAAMLTFFFHNRIGSLAKALVWFDAVGLAVFCVLGAAKTMDVTGIASVAVMMGVVSAVVGGILRDVLVNDVPLILREDIYATAAFAGALVYVILNYVLNNFWSFPDGNLWVPWIAIAVALLVRSLALIFGLSLPRVR